MAGRLRVAFVPEHFSTPLYFARTHGYFKNVQVELVPYISGTGSMIQAFAKGEVDAAVGLTEAWIAGIGRKEPYRIVGSYVQSPLCWAISTGAHRDITSAQRELRGKTIGVSKIGSGSWVMPTVFSYLQKWTTNPADKFKFEVLHTWDEMCQGADDGKCDAIMWEKFTSKEKVDQGKIKFIGEFYTPWPSWLITARDEAIGNKAKEIKGFLDGVTAGIRHFNDHNEDAIEYIGTHLAYTKDDAREWIKTVEFVKDAAHVDKDMLESTVHTLVEAGVMKENVPVHTLVSSVVES